MAKCADSCCWAKLDLCEGNCRRGDIHTNRDRPRSRESNEVHTRAASHIEHTAAALSVEIDEAQQVVKLLEVVRVEVLKEARRSRRVGRDGEVVDVIVPIRADPAAQRAGVRRSSHGQEL